MKLKRDRKRGIEKVISDVRAKVNEQYPQLDVEFVQVLQDMISDLTGSPEPMEIKLFSSDPALLKVWGPKVADRIKKIKGVVDVKDGIENTISGPAIVMNVDPVVAARSGFTPQEIELDASAILQGEPATTPVVVNDRSYTIRVRFPEDTRATLEQIRNTMITSSSTGKTATLGSLADFQDEAGQTEILRENLQREVAVTGRFEGVSLGTGMEMVQQAVADMHVPSVHPRRVRRNLTPSSRNVPGHVDRVGARRSTGLHRAAVRIPHFRRAHRHYRVRAAFDVRRLLRAADHRQERSTFHPSWD